MDTLQTRLDNALQAPERTIGDDGFSDAVMSRMPRRRLGGAKARRWTLGAAAAMGSFLASLLSAPLENAFSSLVLQSGYETMILTTSMTLIVVGVIAVPVVWALYSR